MHRQLTGDLESMSYVAAPKRARRWWITAIVIALAIISLDTSTGWAGSYIYKAFIKLPNTRDLRLVGQWRGSWKGSWSSETHYRKVLFMADGKGKSFLDENDRYWRPFDWGTENGVLYTRRMATDAWSGERHPYAFDGDSKAVAFGNKQMFGLVGNKMTRQ